MGTTIARQPASASRQRPAIRVVRNTTNPRSRTTIGDIVAGSGVKTGCAATVPAIGLVPRVLTVPVEATTMPRRPKPEKIPESPPIPGADGVRRGGPTEVMNSGKDLGDAGPDFPLPEAGSRGLTFEDEEIAPAERDRFELKPKSPDKPKPTW